MVTDVGGGRGSFSARSHPSNISTMNKPEGVKEGELKKGKKGEKMKCHTL